MFAGFEKMRELARKKRKKSEVQVIENDDEKVDEVEEYSKIFVPV